MITEDYVSFETAKLLKEKGFDGSCHRYYRCDKEDIDGNGKVFMFASDLNGFCYVTNSLLNDYGDKYEETVLAPTLQMAMKWLRKEHYCHIIIDYTFTADANLSEEYASYCYKVENAKTYIQHTQDEWYNTSEEACDAAIQYCLKNLI